VVQIRPNLNGKAAQRPQILGPLLTPIWFDLRAIKFALITLVGERRVSRGSDTPCPIMDGPSAQRNFWFPY